MSDVILGDATSEEVGTGAGVLNAAQQFANAVGAAALGTVFFAHVGQPSTPSYFAAAQLVFCVCRGSTSWRCRWSGSCPSTPSKPAHQLLSGVLIGLVRHPLPSTAERRVECGAQEPHGPAGAALRIGPRRARVRRAAPTNR
ncbi:hypothetical protein [Streptomyces sp. NPDC094472]|uniref:hypothetical protein n=1 Tax=unclassified Streptomyces TaxID=2593676 RepID=UPI00333191E9